MSDESEKPRQIQIVFGNSLMDTRLWEWIEADRAAAGRKFNLNGTFKMLLYDWYVSREETGAAPPPTWKKDRPPISVPWQDQLDQPEPEEEIDLNNPLIGQLISTDNFDDY